MNNDFASHSTKNRYQAIDPRMVPVPHARIEVKYRNMQNMLLAGVCAFFVLMSIVIVYQTVTSPFSTTDEVIVKSLFVVFLCIFVGFLYFLTRRGKRKAVRSFDQSGIVRGDGRHFSWNEFQGVIIQQGGNRYGKLYIWREEVVFSGGERAWLVWQRIKNADEVFRFTSQLPRAVLKETR